MPMFKPLKIIKVVSIILVAVLTCAIGGAYLFEDELKNYAFEQIEARLISHVDIKGSNFSFLDKFPKASLELKDVWIEDPVTAGDTLLFAKQIFLAFSPWDIFQGDYSVERIDIEEASICMIESAELGPNYLFWKSSPDSTGNFKFDLSQLRVEKTHYLYTNLKTDVFIDVLVDKMVLKAEITNEQTTIQFEGDAKSNVMNLSKLKGLKEESLSLNGGMRILDQGEQLYFDHVNLKLAAGDLNWDGKILVAEQGVIMDGEFKLNNCNLSRVNQNFPSLLQDVFKQYIVDAKINAEGSIKGKTFGDEIPEINAQVKLVDGRFVHRGSGEELSDIELVSDLIVFSDKTFRLDSKSAVAEFRHGELGGSGLISNHTEPYLDITLKGNARLEELKSFFDLDTLELFDGDIDFNASWKGAIPNWNVNAETISKTNLKGNVEIHDASMKLKANSKTIESIEGTLLLDGSSVAVNDLRGMIGKSDFKIDGFIKNLLGYVTDKNEVLRLEASYYAEKIYLDELLNESSEIKQGPDQAYKLGIPQQLSCNLNLQIDELVFKDFKAKNITGIARIAEGHLELNPVSFATSDGDFLAELSLAPSAPGHFQLLCDAKVKGIDVSKLFRSLDNFGQNMITDRHLKGKADADISFSADVNELLYLDPKKIYSLIEISIQDGELIALESLTGISDYLRNNKLISGFVEVDEFDRKLRHVRFSELSNTIEIKDQIIRFPKMNIASSAMDISAYGSHSFDNEIDYSITFRIRDVLKKKKSEFGEEEDDGLGSKFFLAMTGTTADPSFAFDRDAAKAERKEKRVEEIKEFKNILKEEFGLFKKDKKIEEANKDEPKKEVKVTVDWGETQDSAKKAVDEPEPKKKKSWLERLKEEDETEAPPIEEDDDYF